MSEPRSRLDPEPAAALQDPERAFGPLQNLDVHPTPPERRSTRCARAGRAAQPGLLDTTPKPQADPCPSNPEVTP
jgi:hypothetical protein